MTRITSGGHVDGYLEITYEVADRVATVALHRPERRNGFTARMSDELANAFARADADDDVRVVIFTGHGKDFCVGADLSGGELDVNDDEAAEYHEPAGRVSLAIYALNKPVIAAIRGAAVGAGSTIILPADFRLASTDARFGYVFTRRGLIPEGASAWFLPRLVGLGRALDWMVSGRVFTADEALAAGLVTRLHEPDEVLAAAHALAAELIATTAPVAVAVTRQLLHRMSPLDSPFPARDLDSRLIHDAAGNPDVAEGVLSFLRKEPPSFPGRVSTDLPGYLPWRDGGTA
ncbi:MAG TPA: enoyl-CoA hydratase-related protein [Pseudonocardiaceae bacterium]|jgi:enoyl-CoA hydratase/carnithine racemase|nr:enoyl-CoA hydratase-related protein [Pseudonocardiaceae bacterium]